MSDEFKPLVVGQAWPANVEESYVQYRNRLLTPKPTRVIHALSPMQIRRLDDLRRAFRERFELETGLNVDSMRQRNSRIVSLGDDTELPVAANQKAEVGA